MAIWQQKTKTGPFVGHKNLQNASIHNEHFHHLNKTLALVLTDTLSNSCQKLNYLKFQWILQKWKKQAKCKLQNLTRYNQNYKLNTVVWLCSLLIRPSFIKYQNNSDIQTCCGKNFKKVPKYLGEVLLTNKVKILRRALFLYLFVTLSATPSAWFCEGYMFAKKYILVFKGILNNYKDKKISMWQVGEIHAVAMFWIRKFKIFKKFWEIAEINGNLALPGNQ